jgi:hypothetical protein
VNFSQYETRFADEIFHPFLEGAPLPLAYGPWMMGFAVSVAWRVLHMFRDNGESNGTFDGRAAEFESTLAIWKSYLLGERDDIAACEMHIWPLGLVERAPAADLPPNMNRYITRSVDVTTYTDEKTSFAYLKMPSMALFGFARVLEPTSWLGTRIDRSNGVLGTSYQVPDEIPTYLIKRAQSANSLAASMSSRQRERLVRAMEADIERVAESRSFEAVQRDVEMFGRDAFTPD